MSTVADTETNVVSLFTGAMGLDLGLERAGFRTAVAVESDSDAVATIRANRPDVPVIDRRIEDVSTAEIIEAAGLEAGGVALLAGGPACQSFSTAGNRGSLKGPLGSLFFEFARVLSDIRPAFFVMENVSGLLSAALHHRPLNKRGPGHPPLRTEEELGSAFRLVAECLSDIGYHVLFDVLNAANFGVAQSRQRLILIGSRDGVPIKMPLPSHGDEGSGYLPKWKTLTDALDGLMEHEPEYVPFVPSRRKYFKYVPSGGNWRDLPEGLRAQALGRAYESWGGRSGFFRRLSWDRPSPTLNTSPDYKATALCHPDKLRPLSVGEYARLQGFPDEWRFCGSTRSKYRQIGNAVPVQMAEALGHAISDAIGGRSLSKLRGNFECHNFDLLDRLSARPRTLLNPPRMRESAASNASSNWTKDRRVLRNDAKQYAPDHLADSVGKRKVAKRISQRLRDAYGSPNLGNYQSPVDELFFILLSQRTTGPSYERVFPRFKSWIGDWNELPKKRVEDVAEAISEAGLSGQKSKHALGIAEKLYRDFGEVSLNRIMDSSDIEVQEYLTSLPGVGIKTAKCVMMFSMGRQVLPVDAHVARIADRVGLVNSSSSKSRTNEVLEAVVPQDLRYDFHVNAVAHGRAVCRARNPKCSECAIKRLCHHGRSSK